MKELSTEQIKKSAKFLRKFLLEKHKIDLPHGHALEVASNFLGYKDWNTASALSIDVSAEKLAADKLLAKPKDEMPIAAKLQTAGELSDFFSKLPRDKKVVVNEYRDVEADAGNLNSISDSLGGTITSVCSLTYDSEIQSGKELWLELNTEVERVYQLMDFGKSSSQKFERTPAGRSQRRIKYFFMKSGFWNPRATDRN